MSLFIVFQAKSLLLRNYACLAHIYYIVVSLRHLKRILERLRLYRRKHRTGILKVALFIEGEFGHTGQLHGYT